MNFSIFTYKVAGIESSGGLFQKSEDSETIKKNLEKLEFCFGGCRLGNENAEDKQI